VQHYVKVLALVYDMGIGKKKSIRREEEPGTGSGYFPVGIQPLYLYNRPAGCFYRMMDDLGISIHVTSLFYVNVATHKAGQAGKATKRQASKVHAGQFAPAALVLGPLKTIHL